MFVAQRVAVLTPVSTSSKDSARKQFLRTFLHDLATPLSAVSLHLEGANRRLSRGEDPAALTDTTPLMTTGIIDSIAVLKLVTFLENEFDITIDAHEAVVDHLNTISDITRLVMSKKA